MLALKYKPLATFSQTELSIHGDFNELKPCSSDSNSFLASKKPFYLALAVFVLDSIP